MPQNITQLSATGSYSDLTTADVTTQAAWSVSDSTIATVGANTGIIAIQPAGQIWGATIGVTATLAPGTPGTASMLVIASDSGSVAPRMPQQDDHWRALGLTPFQSYWGCQEQTGSLMGSGSAALTLTASISIGNTQYQTTTPGWIRNAIAISGGLGQSFFVNLAPPTANGNSFAFLCYSSLAKSNTNDSGLLGILHPTPASRKYILLGVSAGPLYTGNEATYQTPVGPVTQEHYDRVHPYLLVLNNTTGDVVIATDITVGISGSSPAVPTDAAKGFGSIGGRPTPSASFLYMAIATGTVAEALSSTSASADFLTRLGWNVVWKDCPTDSGTIKLPFLPSHYKQLGFQPWTATWNMQDTLGQTSLSSFDMWSGKSISGWSMTVNAASAYEYALPNWTRKGLALQATTTSRAFINNVFGPPANFDSTGSMAMLTYGVFKQPTVSSIPLGCGSTSAAASQALCVVLTTGQPVALCAGGSATGSTSICDGRVHPLMLVYDKTNSRMKLYTDFEKLTGSFNALALTTSVTSSFGIGNASNLAATAVSGAYLYTAFATGTLAESLSDDGVASAYLKALGWTIPW